MPSRRHSALVEAARLALRRGSVPPDKHDRAEALVAKLDGLASELEAKRLEILARWPDERLRLLLARMSAVLEGADLRDDAVRLELAAFYSVPAEDLLEQ